MTVADVSSGPDSSRRQSAFRCPEPNVRDPREDDELINQFPLLIPQSADEEQRQEFEERYSILTGESIRFRELLMSMARARLRARKAREKIDREVLLRALHEYYRPNFALDPRQFDHDARMLTEAIAASRDTIQFVIQEYFPIQLRKRLEMTMEVGSSQDAVELILECAGRGTDIHSRVRRFEARRQLTFAMIEFELARSGSGRNDLMRDMAWFAEVCDETYFVKQESELRTVVATLDAENENRVKRFDTVLSRDANSRAAVQENQYRVPLSVRFLPPRTPGGRHIPVYLDTRVKQHVPLKLIKKRQRHYGALTDLCGAKFVFFNEEEDLVAGVERIRRTIARAPGCISGEVSNIARAGQVDPHNAHSSEEYRARKWDVRLNNRTIELQFMYLPYYLNEQVSHGRDNHELYKLSQYMDLLFPVIFPTDLYGLDWRDMALRERLWSYQLTRI